MWSLSTVMWRYCLRGSVFAEPLPRNVPFSEVSACDISPSVARFFRGVYSPTATTAPSLKPPRPERFSYKVLVSLGYHQHPKVFLLFFWWGLTILSGRCSHLSGSSYANAISSFYLCLGGGRPLHILQFLIAATCWTSQLLASHTSVRKPSYRTHLMSS
jgi:hypothetical protein